MAAHDDRGRATIYDDRIDRKGTAYLWRYGHDLVQPGAPLEGHTRTVTALAVHDGLLQLRSCRPHR